MEELNLQEKQEADERRRQYEICRERGHQPSGMKAMSNSPQDICKWCGTHYWYTEPQLVEGMGKPV